MHNFEVSPQRASSPAVPALLSRNAWTAGREGARRSVAGRQYRYAAYRSAATLYDQVHVHIVGGRVDSPGDTTWLLE